MWIKVTSVIDPYSFENQWILDTIIYGERKRFFLGQSFKFCIKTLNKRPLKIVEEIGPIDFSNIVGQRKLGKYIQKQLRLTQNDLYTMNELE
jgi:hypothetical protein